VCERRKAVQHVQQVGRAELGRSTRARSKRRETYLLSCHCISKAIHQSLLPAESSIPASELESKALPAHV
jgi:hypothetical protein